MPSLSVLYLIRLLTLIYLTFSNIPGGQKTAMSVPIVGQPLPLYGEEIKTAIQCAMHVACIIGFTRFVHLSKRRVAA